VSFRSCGAELCVTYVCVGGCVCVGCGGGSDGGGGGGCVCSLVPDLAAPSCESPKGLRHLKRLINYHSLGSRDFLSRTFIRMSK
jgi:hypothetical protein